MEQLIISLLLALVGACILTPCSLKILQIYQLSSYKAAGFWGWIKRTGGEFIIRYFALSFFQFISLLIFCFSFQDSYLKYIAMALYIALGVYFIFLQTKQKQKTPLKITKRVSRQLVILSLLYFCLSFLAVYFTLETAVSYSLLAGLTLLIPLVVTLAHFIALPLESMINSHFKRKAKAALGNGIIKIGITGSYGKTTAKNILTALLSQKYNVLASPASHNTPMGICKLVNGGIDGYQVLIAEMGARHRGDIAELCDLVNPDYGIITITGPQHLETFGSIDEVVKTKIELAEGTSKMVVLNSDDVRLMEAASGMAFAKKRGKTGENDKKCGFLYSGIAGADASYGDVKVTRDGTLFTVTIGGQSMQITTLLLGRHIPALFTQCALLAIHMGVTLQQIAKAAIGIKPVEHRLQLIKSQNATVIDDAYNSNPEGAKNALEVLNLFEGTKVLITPGFVEMGRIQPAENKNLGALAAGCTDYLISVGSSDICLGAKDAGMDSSRIFEETSLKNATDRLALLELNNPVILFLNDLPDNY